MNKLNDIEELTFQLYDNIKRFQINVDETLAITLILIYTIYARQEQFISAIEPKSKDKIKNYNNAIDLITDYINNDFNASFITQKTSEYIINNIRQYDVYYKVQRSIIKNAIEKLIDEKSQLLQTSNRKTASFTQKIITEIANKLVDNGNYIDLAIGTGSLLKDFDGDLYGIDVNPKMVIIARVYLFFCGKYKKLVNNHWEANITQADAIDDYISYKKDCNNIIIFDPPMGDYRKYPKFEEWQQTNILDSKKPIKLQSELLFLLSFLINADDDDYFIGLFPENVLTKNNKDYISIRKYLIENSLIAVIKVLESHVLLIGKKKLNINDYGEIPVIRIQSSLNEKQLDFISSEIIKGGNFDFDKYLSIEPRDFGTIIKEYDGIESYNKDFKSITRVVYNRKDFKDNYIINLPPQISYEDIYSNQIKSPIELLNSLQEKENTIKTLMQNLSENITNAAFYTEHIEEKQPELLWFEEYNPKRDPELLNALNYFFRFGYQLNSNNINNYQDFQIRENINADSYANLKILYKDGRVKLIKNKEKIYFGEDENLKIKKFDLNEFYKSFDPLQDSKVSKILAMVTTDNNIKLIFEDLCKYYMLDQNEDKTLLKRKVLPIKEFTRSLKVLENLGLVIFDKRKVAISDQGHSDVDLYNRYIPNIKYVNAIKFEESQNVR